MPTDAAFAMVCCQNGSEPAVKQEVAREGWRLAYSRRGFITLKHEAKPKGLPRGVFVRTACWSLGMIKGEDFKVNLDRLVTILRDSGVKEAFDRLHVWPRDRVPVGKFDFEPGPDELSQVVGEGIAEGLLGRGLIRSNPLNSVAAAGERVLDVVLIDPSQWAIGWHEVPKLAGPAAAKMVAKTWPGGVQPLEPGDLVLSRAYFKVAEAIAWSGLEMQSGDLAIEVGASPGGSCGLLLERGLRVIGIDPAEMDPEILTHPNFRHLRARAGELPRSEYHGAKWLLVDSNVRPDQTLTTVEQIVTHRESTIQGMLLTLKLGSIEHADRIEGWVRKVRQWKAHDVRVRQLARSRIEVCLTARINR
jgi:23S rRNA (cytidine2498-2'-O)-methyltransferase